MKVPSGVRDVKQNMPLFVAVEVERSPVLGLQLPKFGHILLFHQILGIFEVIPRHWLSDY